MRWPLLLAGIILTAVTGCSSTAPTVTVSVGDQEQELTPTQYCLDGESEVYRDQDPPPVLRVSGDLPIRIDVPDEVAESGWQVQVFDSELEEQLGQVDAGNATSLDEIRTGDAATPEYYLVIVQDAGADCDGLSGAWPIGFVRG
ncbi:MAG: DUF2771 family protein [Geodermatophilaceae bacterium]|nr:DUF2771 family protein [Geodermatophilaceae bacterium]